MFHLHPCCPQRRRAASGDARVGVGDRIDDPPYPGGNDGVSTRRRAPVVAAGLQRAVQRGSLRRRAGLCQRADLRVGLAGRQRETLARHARSRRQ